MHFETPHNEIKYVLSVKESSSNEKKVKNFTFAYGQGQHGRPPPPPPYGQPDCKMLIFLTTRLRALAVLISECTDERIPFVTGLMTFSNHVFC